jgi:hypothetical protein
MPDNEVIEKISKISGDGKEETTTSKKTVPNADHFEGLMQQSTDPSKIKVEEAGLEEATKTNSLMDEVRNSSNSTYYGKATPDTLTAETQNVISQIDQIKESLSDPNLQLKGSVQTLMNSKLEHIDESLKAALENLGSSSEYKSPAGLPSMANPLERFIGFLTHSQYHLDHINDDVAALALNGKELSPAAILAVQVKVTMVGQQLEFFTSCLNKALESTKTVMNVQV